MIHSSSFDLISRINRELGKCISISNDGSGIWLNSESEQKIHKKAIKGTVQGRNTHGHKTAHSTAHHCNTHGHKPLNTTVSWRFLRGRGRKLDAELGDELPLQTVNFGQQRHQTENVHQDSTAAVGMDMCHHSNQQVQVKRIQLLDLVHIFQICVLLCTQNGDPFLRHNIT